MSQSNLDEHSKLIEAFSRHYNVETSHWSGHSGGGSHPHFTIQYRNFVDQFLYLNSIKSVVDVGCGDWQFSKYLNYDSVDYIGYDLVEKIVSNNTSLYGRSNIKFKIMPSEYENLEAADLLIMKDVLQHLSKEQIFQIEKIVFPKYKYCLITNSYRKMNTSTNNDIVSGDFRCLDLRAPPFSMNGVYILEFSSPLWEHIRTLLVINQKY